MIQGSPEWLEWRKTHIGASDQTHLQWSASWSIGWGALWDIKMGLVAERDPNLYMSRGIELESHALIAYSLLRNSEFRPAIVESEEYPYISASMDAVNDRGEVAEIKCPGADDHALAAKGEIPRKYIPQLCHQLYVTQAPEIDYVSYDGSEIKIVRYKRDEELIKKIVAAAKLFHWHLVTMSRPEEHPLPEFDTRIPVIHDLDIHTEAVKNIMLRDGIDSFEKQLEESNKKILLLCDDFPRVKIGNLLQVVSTDRGNAVMRSIRRIKN